MQTPAGSSKPGSGTSPGPAGTRTPSPALSIVGRPTFARGSVRLTLACRRAPCSASAVLKANAGRRMGQTIGASTVNIRAGARATIRISLNSAGRRLLATHHRTTVRVVLSLAGGNGGARVVGSVPVTLGS